MLLQENLEKARRQLEQEKAGFAADMQAHRRAIEACRAGRDILRHSGDWAHFLGGYL